MGCFVIEKKAHIEKLADSTQQDRRPVSWAQWKADQLNKLFLEQGHMGKPGKITPETVRHGSGQ